MKKILFVSAIIASLGFAFSVTATEPMRSPDFISLDAFRQYKEISMPTIKVPTVVEVSLPEVFSNRFDFAVLLMGSGQFEPYLFRERLSSPRTVFSIHPGVLGANVANHMNDGDSRTFSEFPLPESGQGEARLVLTGEKPMTLAGMTLFLDQYVTLPTSIEVRTRVGGVEKIVLARSKMQSETVVFPKTTSSEWIVSLSYGQPLRIAEITLNESGTGVSSARTLRFLAQPGQDYARQNYTYRVYFDADRAVSIRTKEAGNLSSDVGVLRLPYVSAQQNPNYSLADTDGDSVPDMRDNCTSVANPDQVDLDGNGRGDVCDDFDRDSVMNSIDNCVNEPNRYQEDVDGDKIGDLCDGEESRVTEKYSWLPWVGMGFAGLVLIVLFAITARSMMKKNLPPRGPEQQG
jgi:hypothetical protein